MADLPTTANSSILDQPLIPNAPIPDQPLMPTTETSEQRRTRTNSFKGKGLNFSRAHNTFNRTYKCLKKTFDSAEELLRQDVVSRVDVANKLECAKSELTDINKQYDQLCINVTENNQHLLTQAEGFMNELRTLEDFTLPKLIAASQQATQKD